MTATGIGANSRSADAKGEGLDELKARREERMPADPRYCDHPVLQRLTQCLQHRPGELPGERSDPGREGDR